MSMHGEDVNNFGVFCENQEEEVVVVVGKEDEEIWFQTASQHNQNNNMNNYDNTDINLDANSNDPSSLFYAEFPALPDFTCKSSASASSSSSSSSNRVVLKQEEQMMRSATAQTSSSASTASSVTASWADPYQEKQGEIMLGGGDVEECMDIMDDFSCMDLLDQTSDICWDPSPLFDGDGDGDGDGDHQFESHYIVADGDNSEEEHVFRQFMLEGNVNDANNGNCVGVEIGQSSSCGGGSSGDELAKVFFEWLKTNKETVSAEDLRNIKIKKSTIESAARRLGGGKEGMKQLLKLILQWVQNHHLQTNCNPNPGPNPSPVHNNQELNCMNPSAWLAPLPPDVGPTSGFVGYGGYPVPPPPSIIHPEFNNWAPQGGPPMQYGMGMNPYGTFLDAGFVRYPGGYYYHHGRGAGPGPCLGEGLVRLGSSATKEARKKRMARQRRFFSHHRNHSNSHSHSLHNNGNINNNLENIGQINSAVGVGGADLGHGNWVYWPHPQQQPMMPARVPVSQLGNGSGPMVGQMGMQQERVGICGFPRQVGGVEKKQGWKAEKNLRFLLQKVLKQSDVGNLGRIVLPKKEAETHLPELEARDGINIAMEDIGTSRVWNMRYRFWPNNKSRMYLLENTGDFVRSNGLQEGDFIVIYSDVKCGKYMIRGVKVRPQQSANPETITKTSKPNKTQKTLGCSTPAGNAASSSSLTMMQ